MNDTLFYTLPQWFIFAGIFVIVYGWVEDKKPFRIIGNTILFLLGVFSIIILSGDFLAAGNFLTPEEVALEEIDDEVIEEIPILVKLIPAYWSFVASAILAIPAIILDLKDKRKYRLFTVFAGLVSLFGFFLIVGAIKTL